MNFSDLGCQSFTRVQRSYFFFLLAIHVSLVSCMWEISSTACENRFSFSSLFLILFFPGVYLESWGNLPNSPGKLRSSGFCIPRFRISITIWHADLFRKLLCLRLWFSDGKIAEDKNFFVRDPRWHFLGVRAFYF